MKTTLNDILDVSMVDSLLNKVEPTEHSAYRFICREYSKKFHTPLHIVEHELALDYVILHYCESQLDAMDIDENIEKILDKLYELQDPEYVKQKKQNLDEDIKKYEDEEELRLAEGRPIHGRSKKSSGVIGKPIEKKKEVAKVIPTKGSISLAHLESEDSEGSGFDE